MPFTWDVVNRGRLPRVYRSWSVSAYMKSVRLGRAEDACYWWSILHKANVGDGYLGRRLLASSAEDNLDVSVMLACEAAMTADLEGQLHAVYRSAIGTKWFEREDGRAYTRARIEAGGATSPPTITFEQALAELDVGAVYRHLSTTKTGRRAVFLLVAEAGARSADEGARQLAGLIQRQSWWLAAFGELNPVWQLVWRIAHGPFASAGRVATREEYEQLRVDVARRLAAEIEAPPSWALDGVHTTGKDPRFAGSWAGLENMIAMYLRDGRLDPSAPGATVHADTSAPSSSPRTSTRAAQLEKSIAQLERNLVIWTTRVATTEARLAKARAARAALGDP